MYWSSNETNDLLVNKIWYYYLIKFNLKKHNSGHNIGTMVLKCFVVKVILRSLGLKINDKKLIGTFINNKWVSIDVSHKYYYRYIV